MEALQELTNTIEQMGKEHHIQILKILIEDTTIRLNSNKCGVFVNMSYLSPTTIEKIQAYVAGVRGKG
jgi:hypothetical protein